MVCWVFQAWRQDARKGLRLGTKEELLTEAAGWEVLNGMTGVTKNGVGDEV